MLVDLGGGDAFVASEKREGEGHGDECRGSRGGLLDVAPRTKGGPCYEKGTMVRARLLRLALPALSAAVAICSSEPEARALGPIDLEGGLKVGVGTTPATFAASPLGFGIGGRAGVGFFNVYAGVSAMYYAGSSTDVPSSIGPQTFSSSSTLLGLEVGYSIHVLRRLTIRPQIGVGNFAIASGDASQNFLYLEPGVTALVSLGRFLYVGADANVLILPSAPQDDGPAKALTALTLHGQIGVKL